MTKISAALRIGQVTSQREIREAVAFHQASFRNNFKGNVGKWFLEFYFRRIARSTDGVIYTCRDGEKIAGLIIGMSSKNKIHDLPFFCWGAMVTLWHLFTCPHVFILILRHIKRMLTVPQRIKCDAELESIAVDPQYQRMGIGMALVNQLESFFVSKNIREYELVTDRVKGQGYKFYEKIGFLLAGEVSLFNLESRIYQKKLNPSAAPLDLTHVT